MAELVDKAKEAADLNKDGKIDAADAQLAVSKAAKFAKDAMAKAEAEGFLSHFGDYNKAIIKPLEHANTVTLDGVKNEIFATLGSCPPKPADPISGFILYNVLALLLGVAESAVLMMLGIKGGVISLVWNVGLSYCIAYTLYWIFICKQTKAPMFYALIFLALYTAFNACTRSLRASMRAPHDEPYTETPPHACARARLNTPPS